MSNNNNFLVPKHVKLSEEQIQVILNKYQLEHKLKFPKIKIKDPALEGLDVQINDVVEISRTSFAGKSKYYRVVVE